MVNKMKKIEAIIRTSKVDAVKNSLDAIGCESMTVSEVKGRGKQKGVIQQWRGVEYVVDFIPKSKMEMVLEDDMVEQVINVICETAQTGKIGDGKIFILPVVDAIRVRTKERGSKAL